MNARSKYLRTFGDTAWIYPIADIDYALSTTTHPYRRDGNNIICSILPISLLSTQTYLRERQSHSLLETRDTVSVWAQCWRTSERILSLSSRADRSCSAGAWFVNSHPKYWMRFPFLEIPLQEQSVTLPPLHRILHLQEYWTLFSS